MQTTQAQASVGPSTDRQAAGPLKGLKIIDLTAVLMGPYCTQMLGDMGADVIKVEPPDGDMVRQIGPARHADMGPIFLNTNHSKRSIVIDLKKPEGLDLLMRLISDADVLVYNVRPQAMERLGLSYEKVSAVNPRLIYTGVFGYAQNGPYAARPAYDDLMQGASTLASLFARSTGGPPQYVPNALCDRITGMSAVGLILAAVYERQTSGLGQRIDVPMFETMVNFVLSDHLGGLTYEPPLDSGGYARQLSKSRRPYQTSNGYISALIYTDKHWQSFFKAIGKEEEFARNPLYSSFTARSQNIDAIYAELETILRTRSTEAWLECLTAADIPATVVHDLNSIFQDPHLLATGFFATQEHPSEGTLRTMQFPSTWSRTQPEVTRHAPRHGEHTAEILREAGLSPAQEKHLFEQGVVKSAPPLTK